MPAIAIVDSGIDGPLRGLQGTQVKAKVGFVTSASANASGDGRGHGRFVAGIAAGNGAGYAGVSPECGLVSLDVMDDSGSGKTSDVIAAAEWIYRNKAAYNISVANYSLHGGGKPLLQDPLNVAVTKLWLSGVDGDRGCR